MNSSEICSRQNQDKFLKIQYAARVNFNSAERFNRFAWGACLVSAFSVFFPSAWSVYIIYAIPFIADMVAAICCYIASYKVKWGAKLRKYFDAYVLDICADQFSETEIKRILEKSKNEFLKFPEAGQIQITNTGHDDPPGVRDWYEFSEFLDGVNAKFECQRQNIWWNRKMSKKRILTILCMGIAIAIIFILFAWLTNKSMLIVTLCSSGIIGKIVERIIANVKYFHLSVLIDGSQQTVEVHPTEENVKQLQCLINERRAVNVTENDYFHRRFAAKLSDLYKKIRL